MKSKIALPLLVCVAVLLMSAIALAQAGAGNAVSTNIAAGGVSSSATEDLPAADGSPGGSLRRGTGMTDAQQVREAVDRFRHYFELQNADLLRSEIWPSMSPKAYRQMKNTFKVLAQVSLQENCAGAPVVVSDFAEWTCSEKLGYQVGDERMRTQTHSLRFHLKNVDGKWYVEQRTLVSR